MYCSKCGKEIDDDAIVCPLCGVATKNFNDIQHNQQPQVVVNNTNTNLNQNTNTNINQSTGATAGRARNKWIALLLCISFGTCGAHKFYEGKTGMGLLYLFTFGLCFIGVIFDFIALLFKPNPYYV